MKKMPDEIIALLRYGLRLYGTAFGFVGIAFLAGCATPVKTEFKAGAEFKSYHTYALLPIPLRPDRDPGEILRLALPAREAVKKSLNAKGFSETTTNEADLAVNIQGKYMPRVEVKDYGYHYTVMTRSGPVNVVQNPSTSSATYHERTLSIEMLDPHSKEVVWVGSITKDSSREPTPEAMQEAVAKILEKFPPQADSKKP
jgi:hypothetical protein